MFEFKYHYRRSSPTPAPAPARPSALPAVPQGENGRAENVTFTILPETLDVKLKAFIKDLPERIRVARSFDSIDHGVPRTRESSFYAPAGILVQQSDLRASSGIAETVRRKVLGLHIEDLSDPSFLRAAEDLKELGLKPTIFKFQLMTTSTGSLVGDPKLYFTVKVPRNFSGDGR